MKDRGVESQIKLTDKFRQILLGTKLRVKNHSSMRINTCF